MLQEEGAAVQGQVNGCCVRQGGEMRTGEGQVDQCARAGCSSLNRLCKQSYILKIDDSAFGNQRFKDLDSG